LANKIYEDKLFNEDLKYEFINQYGFGTQKVIVRLFKVSQVMEAEMDKDIYDFNREELRRFFFFLMPKTEAASNSNVTWIQKYIEWAIDEGHKEGLNPLDMVDSTWKKQFANANLKQLWTDKEIDEIVDPTKRANYQDAALVMMLFSGIKGQGNSEILSLREKDINFKTNEVLLHDEDGSTRTTTVSDKCIEFMRKALNETEYEKMNGFASPDIKAPTAKLVENEYVIKSATTRTIHFEEADKFIVSRRISKIADEINMPTFTPTAVFRSGMLAMAKDVYLEQGDLSDESILSIQKQFGGSDDSIDYRLKQDILNIDLIKEVYQIP
jgi:integrase